MVQSWHTYPCQLFCYILCLGQGKNIKSIARNFLVCGEALNNTQETKKNVVIYSDTCTDQNRNFNITFALMRLIQTDEMQTETTEQKLLVSGHSYLPRISDFGSMELIG